MKGGEKVFFLVLNPVTIVMNLDMASFWFSCFPGLVFTMRKKSRNSFGVDYITDIGKESQYFSSYNHNFTASRGAHLCLVGNCQWEVTHHILPVREEISFFQYMSFQMTLNVSY